MDTSYKKIIVHTPPKISHCGFDVTGRNFLITGEVKVGVGNIQEIERERSGQIVIAAEARKGGSSKGLDGDGCRVRFVQADTADPKSVKSLASEAASLMKGPIHGLVNAAASTAREILTTSVDDFY